MEFDFVLFCCYINVKFGCFFLQYKVHIQLEADSNKKKKNLDVWTTGSNLSKRGLLKFLLLTFNKK